MLRLLEKHRIRSCYVPGTVITMRLGGTSNRSSAALQQSRHQRWRSSAVRCLMVFVISQPFSRRRCRGASPSGNREIAPVEHVALGKIAVPPCGRDA